PGAPRPEPPPPAGDDDFDLSYELRDVSSAPREPSSGEVLTDEDLAHDLHVDPAAVETPQPVESDDSLLDRTVQSNLELAQRFGDLDEQRLLLERKVHELVEVAQQTVHDLN